jgi:beta-glucanase (GH16 family)
MRIVFIFTLFLTTATFAQLPDSASTTPDHKPIDVLSVFSDSFKNVANTNFYANWNQATQVEIISIEQNNVLEYSGLNYQGIELGRSVDVSQMEYVHIDVWTSNATALELQLISPGPQIASRSLAINQNEWIGFDIPLSEFSSNANLNELFQMAFNDGGAGNSPTIFLDNIYFYRSETPDSLDGYLVDLTVDGTSLINFDPNTFNYVVELAGNLSSVPQISATLSNNQAQLTIQQAAQIPGQAIIETTAPDGLTTKRYTVDFLTISVPQEPAPTPPARNQSDVISIYSAAYENRANTNFNPNWSQSTKVSEYSIGDELVLKYDDFNYQGTELSGSVDVSGMDYLHVDLWTPDASGVNVSIISPGPLETPVSLPIVKSTWRSYDIPLSSYSRVVNLNEVFQFKFDDAGRGDKPTLYIDNLYFYKGEQNLSSDATLSDIYIDGEALANFTPERLSYTYQLASNASQVPLVQVFVTDTTARYTIAAALDVPGTTVIDVVAEDGETTQRYEIEFTKASASSDASLASIHINGNAIESFLSHQMHYDYPLSSGSNEIPSIEVEATNSSASIELFEATSIPGSAYKKIISEDLSDSSLYSVFFHPENLLWWDEFTRPQLNAQFWNYDEGNGCEDGQNLCGWGNNELQSYSRDHVTIEEIPGETRNTALVITADSPSSGSFKSGRVQTQNKVELQYGMFEIRMMTPDVETGLWPAIWFLGNDHDEVGWPRSGELDLMEMGHKAAFRSAQGFANKSANHFVSSNAIWYAQAACSAANPTCAASISNDVNYNTPYAPTTGLDNRFVNYRLYWTANEIKFAIVDQGKEYFLYAAPFGTTNSELRAAFNKPYFLIMNMAVGGDFTDAATASQVTADMPAKMYIDYVRLYTLNGQGSAELLRIPTSSEPFPLEDLPKGPQLFQNYPNPFNPSTQLTYGLDKTAGVEIRVIDVLGRTVARFKQAKQQAGVHQFSFDASHLPSGIYIYSLFVDGVPIESKKMTLIK